MLFKLFILKLIAKAIIKIAKALCFFTNQFCKYNIFVEIQDTKYYIVAFNIKYKHLISILTIYIKFLKYEFVKSSLL